jgi:hypothetical protein
MLKWLRRLIYLAVLLAILFSNLLSLTVSAVNFALTGLVAATASLKSFSSSISANRRQSLQLETQRSAIRKMGKGMIDRSKRMASRSIAEIPASAIPFAGTAILVTFTLWEFRQLCEGLYDLEELYKEAELEEEVDADVLQTVCHPSGWFTDDVDEQ